MTDLYRIRVLALERPARRVTLRVFSVCYDAAYVRPGIPTDASLFMRILCSDAGFGRGEPLRQEVSDDQFFDEAWIDANTQRFIQRVTRTRLQNDPPAKDKQPPTYVHERFKDEDILTQGDFEVVVTDAKWIEHLAIHMTWQTSACATRATMPRGRATVLADVKAEKALRKAVNALRRAIQRADLAAIRVAVAQGAPLNPTSNRSADWPLNDACYLASGDGPAMRVVELLVALGADVNHRASPFDTPPVFMAAHHGYDALVRCLIARGATLDGTYLSGMSMLHCAARGGLPWLVDRCLAEGADPNASSGYGTRAMDEAFSTAQWKPIAEALERAGAALHENNPWARLHRAAHAGQADAIPWVLARGADLHARTTVGATPLHIAAARDAPSVVAALLAAGADKTLKTTAPWQCGSTKFKAGVTPADVAKRLKRNEAEAWLR